MSEVKAPKMGFEQASGQEQTRLGDCLWDAHAAASKIVEFTTGRSFAEFEENELLRSVVSRMLEIMTDALTELRRHYPDEFQKLEGGDGLLERAAGDREVWRLVGEVVPGMMAQLQTRLEEWHQS